MSTLKVVDLIIPVYKPDKKFEQLMERILEQSVLPKHIFLLHTVEEASDKYRELLGSMTTLGTSECEIRVIEVKKEEFDHGGTRNYGATLSEEDIIMFMTQDAVPANKDLVKNLVHAFEDETVGAAYGRQLSFSNSSVLEKYSRGFNYPEESSVKSKEDIKRLGIKTYFCSNVCAAYRKDVYDEIGGFVTKTIFNEDMIMAYNIIQKGYSIAYKSGAKVYHSHEYTNMQQLKRNFDLSVSQQQYSYVFSSVSSEKEGFKLVKDTITYLMDNKKAIYIPELLVQTAFKYTGYLLGKHYKSLPLNVIKKVSMNPAYWNNKHS